MESTQQAKANYSINSGATFWFTGLSGAGKSTLSEGLKTRVDKMLGDKNKCFILDGDIIRTGLNKGLGFSAEDRAENIRRISEVSKLFAIAGQICIVAFISPYAEHRNFGKKIHQDASLPFFECYINSPLEVCEARDVKGLYKKARAGIIPNFTGVSDPYEAPVEPALEIRTDQLSIEQSIELVINKMLKEGVITDNQQPRVVESLYELALPEDQVASFSTLKSIEIEVEQVEYL
jgi:3'-phosphoadenosine 5'-phosphosulfate synthase